MSSDPKAIAEDWLRTFNQSAPPIQIQIMAQSVGLRLSEQVKDQYEYRFKLARKLAQHIGFKEEFDINCFAANVLLPKGCLLAVAGKYTCEQLASLFEVPLDVLKVRINAK